MHVPYLSADLTDTMPMADVYSDVVGLWGDYCVSLCYE